MSTKIKTPDGWKDVSGGGEVWRPHPDWANAAEITGAQAIAGYTAPDDGIIVGIVVGDSAEGETDMLVNNILVGRGYRAGDSIGSYAQIQAPVNKGDIFKVRKTRGGGLGPLSMHFVPWKAQ